MRHSQHLPALSMSLRRPQFGAGEALGCAYARADRRVEAEKLSTTIPSPNPFNQALIFADLGDKDRDLAAMDRAVTAGPFSNRQGALTWPEPSLLHGHLRVKALRKKLASLSRRRRGQRRS